ncbi:hypothetical protein WN943_007112 [Citrus x changshan-huyou]
MQVALTEKIKGGGRESGESSKVVTREAKEKQSGEEGRAWNADVVWLYSRIHHINQVTAEILEHITQKVLHEKCDIESLNRMRDLFKHNLAFCEKILVPINHGASHWYVVVLDIPGNSVLIWDPLSSDMRKSDLVGDAKKILRALDELLMVDIRPVSGFGGLDFESFRVMQGTTGLSRQPNGYDCGLHVIRFMECHGNVRELDFKHDSDEARKNLAIQLVTVDGNMLKDNVMQSTSQFSFAE